MPSHPDRVRRNYLYWCPICNESFKTKKELDEHSNSKSWKDIIEINNPKILEKYSE